MTTTDDLFDAIRKDDETKVKEILTYNPELINIINMTNENYYGLTPVHYACYYDREKILILLIKNGADLNLSKKSNTLIQAIISKFSVDIIKMMIEHGADIHQKNACGDSPYSIVSNYRYNKYIHLMKNRDV